MRAPAAFGFPVGPAGMWKPRIVKGPCEANAGELIVGDATAGTFKVTLTAGMAPGSTVAIMKTDGGTGQVTVAAPEGGSVLIDGQYIRVYLGARDANIVLVFDGVGFRTMSTRGVVNFSAVAGFDSIPGLVLWFDADASIKRQSTGGATSNPGDVVGSWLDLVSGREAAQPTAANKPLLIANAYNGKSCLRFDGSNDLMTINGDSSEQVIRITLFIVAKATAAGGRVLIGKNHNTSGWSSPFARWILYDGGNYDTRWNGTQTAAGSWSTGDLKVLEMRDSDTWANGTKVVDASGGDLSYPNGLTQILVGSNGIGSEVWNGDIAKVLLWNRSLTDPEASSVRFALGAEYGVTVV